MKLISKYALIVFLLLCSKITYAAFINQGSILAYTERFNNEPQVTYPNGNMQIFDFSNSPRATIDNVQGDLTRYLSTSNVLKFFSVPRQSNQISKIWEFDAPEDSKDISFFLTSISITDGDDINDFVLSGTGFFQEGLEANSLGKRQASATFILELAGNGTVPQPNITHYAFLAETITPVSEPLTSYLIAFFSLLAFAVKRYVSVQVRAST
jgi:hypothetical protein